MKNKFKFRFIGIFAMLAMLALFGVAAMLLWNALCPALFGLPILSYWQTLGLIILARIFVGGLGHFGKGGMGHDPRNLDGNKLREKWMAMNEEERRAFIEKEKDFFKFHRRFDRFHHFFDDEDGEEKGTDDKEKGNE